jgi:general secretion pathway protein D
MLCDKSMRIAAFCVLTLWCFSLVQATEALTPVPPASTTPATAPSTEKSDPVPEDKGHIWNLSNTNIRSVIAEVSRVTGKNFLIDPRVQGTVSIVSADPLTNKELYPVFLSMLQVAGYAAIPSGNVTKIIPIMDARSESSDGLSQLKAPPRGDDLMVQVIPVHYGVAEQLVPVLRSLMPQWSSVTAYAPSNMLILSGRANNIRQLTKIIHQVDNSSVSGIDIIPLHHALAMDVVNTLKEMVKSNQQTMLAADDRSNAILITGTKPERLKLRLLIAKLDKESPNGGSSNTQVIYLSYLRAEDVVPIIAGIAQASFSGTVGVTIGTITQPVLDSSVPESNVANAGAVGPAQSMGSMGSSSPNAGSTQTSGTNKPSIQIIAEPNTNSVILNAPVTVIRTLKAVIRQLDIKPAQLLIEALVAEINERDFQNLGVDWGTVNNDTFRPGFAIINNTSISKLQAQIYALARQEKANILSTPSVVVLDNRQAKILVGKQVSVASSSYPNNANATTTASPYTTFDRMNVALHLYVKPQITQDHGIQMQIDQGNDSLVPTANEDSNTIPIFNISAIITSVHVESGDVIVLGGLAQDSVAKDVVSIPILGDIPGIGRLFQHNVVNREKKVLMVFIRPVILRNERQVSAATNKKYNNTRQLQLDISRAQDEFKPGDRDTVLPPLHTAKLPKPFCRVANHAAVTK